MKIVIFEFEEWERPYFDHFMDKNDVIFEQAPLDEQTASKYQDADIVSVFIYSDLGCPTLKQFKQLKFIATRSTGFDHIDIPYCTQKGIKVSNVPSYGENTVAEHVFALLLSISHKIPDAVNRTRQGNFSQEGLQGFDLCGKTIGIIGTGVIGQKTIKIAKGFDMDVLAYDIEPDTIAAKKLDFSYVSLQNLLSQSDIISLHVPGNKETYHLLSNPEFSLMKKGAILINTARGDVVDVKALLQALASEKLSAAGLDVLPEEPTIREESELLRSLFTEKHNLETLLADHVLLHMKNVVITPHSAFNTKEAVARIIQKTVKNIDEFCEGRPTHLVN